MSTLPQEARRRYAAKSLAARLVLALDRDMLVRESNVLRKAVAVLVAIALWLISNETALAMTFDVVLMNGEPAICARGVIVDGDAARLRATLTPKAASSAEFVGSSLINSPRT